MVAEPSSTTRPPWYVCLTKPRQEQLALRKLLEQRYEVYLPMLTTWQKKKAGWQKAEQVMFPRYLFVRSSTPGQSIGPIRSTPGVSGLVTFGNMPATLDAALLDGLRQIEEQTARPLSEQISPFTVGEPVSITEGPLRGLSGIVSRIARERVVVMLTLLGREKAVAIPVEQLSQGTLSDHADSERS